MSLDRLPALLAALEKEDRADARELLRLVLDLHGEALDAMLEIVAADEAMLAAVAADKRVRGILMLHGLHPEPLETRVARALAGFQGAAIVEHALTDGRLRVRVECGPRSPPAQRLKQRLEDAVFDAAPDVAGIDIEGLPVPVAYVPISVLAR